MAVEIAVRAVRVSYLVRPKLEMGIDDPRHSPNPAPDALESLASFGGRLRALNRFCSWQCDSDGLGKSLRSSERFLVKFFARVAHWKQSTYTGLALTDLTVMSESCYVTASPSRSPQKTSRLSLFWWKELGTSWKKKNSLKKCGRAPSSKKAILPGMSSICARCWVIARTDAITSRRFPGAATAALLLLQDAICRLLGL